MRYPALLDQLSWLTFSLYSSSLCYRFVSSHLWWEVQKKARGVNVLDQWLTSYEYIGGIYIYIIYIFFLYIGLKCNCTYRASLKQASSCCTCQKLQELCSVTWEYFPAVFFVPIQLGNAVAVLTNTPCCFAPPFYVSEAIRNSNIEVSMPVSLNWMYSLLQVRWFLPP